jgi:hypothetical protein
MCGRVCSTGTCSAGVCPTPACKTGVAPKVLVYGPTGGTTGVGEIALLPPGSITTVATETTWRSMTAAQFASYDIILVGGDTSGGVPSSTDLQALYDTRFTWGPVVTGRVALFGMDIGYHASPTGMDPGAATIGRATFSWLAQGPAGKTALYVTTDSGSRSLNFLSPLGAFSSNNFTGESISVTNSAHPVMIGSTSASLSNWSVSYHSTITGFPSTYSSIASGTSSLNNGPVVVVHDEACTP